MDRPIARIFLFCILIGTVFTAPQAPASAAGGAGAGAPPNGILPIALPVHALRKFKSDFCLDIAGALKKTSTNCSAQWNRWSIW